MRAIDGIAFADLSELELLRASPDAQHKAVAFLTEQSPIYAGRSTADAERLRGYLLAGFESAGLPASAIPFVIAELESGLNPHVVAAAAKALRGADEFSGRVVPLLLAAIERIRGSDDTVSFDITPKSRAGEPPVTALMELFRTLAWLGPRASDAEAPLKAMLKQRPSGFSTAVGAEIEKALAAISDGSAPTQTHCCAAKPAPIALTPAVGTPPARPDIRATELQDQDGTVFTFADFFPGRPSVLTFFYTRCMNPNKCSLTITKLARLQKLIDAEGLQGRFNVAAMTYDPGFDLPRRLRGYGADRAMSFDGRNRLLRTTGPFEPFQRWLDLGVGYGSTTVNQHRLDIAILDSTGRPHASVVRLQWDEADVLAALKALPSGPVSAPPEQ